MTSSLLRGWARFTALQWRTSRVALLLSPTALAALVVGTAWGVRSLYGDAADRALYAHTMGSSPAAAAFNGRGYDLQTLGGITAAEVGFMGQIAIPVIGLVLAIRLTRRAEDSGLLELVTAARVSRTAVPAAAATTLAVSWLILVALGTAGLVALDLPWRGSLGYTASLALLGLAFSGLGLVLGQLASTARAATSLGLGLALVLYLVRAVVDGNDWNLVWLTPLGWVAEARPWGTWVWWPVPALAAKAVVAALIAVAVCSRRDLGSGVLVPRRGPARGGRYLATPLGLVWRLTRGSTAGWALGALTWSVAIAAMSQEFVDIVAANPALAQAFGSEVHHLSTVLGLIIGAVLAAGTGITVLQRLGAEEVEARWGLLLAGRVSRGQWWLAWCTTALVASVVVLLTSTTLMGLVQWWVMDRQEALGDAVMAGLAYVVPVAAMVAPAAVVVALRPGWRVLSWAAPVWAMVVAVLGEALRLPGWAKNLSPLELVGRVPVAQADALAVGLIGVGAVVLLVAAGLVTTRRDLVRG